MKIAQQPVNPLTGNDPELEDDYDLDQFILANWNNLTEVVAEQKVSRIVNPSSPIVKGGEHDQKTHGNWARGQTVFRGSPLTATDLVDQPGQLFGPFAYFGLTPESVTRYGDADASFELDNDLNLYESPLYDDYFLPDVAVNAGLYDRASEIAGGSTPSSLQIRDAFKEAGYDGLLLGKDENFSRWVPQVVLWDPDDVIAKGGDHDQLTHGNWASSSSGRKKVEKRLKARLEELDTPVADFVLANGKWFQAPPAFGVAANDYKNDPGAPEFGESVRGYMKELKGEGGFCFENCAGNTSPDLSYVEGYAWVQPMVGSSGGRIEAHAWLVTNDGKVVDPTWRGANRGRMGDRGVAYFGVPIKRSVVEKEIDVGAEKSHGVFHLRERVDKEPVLSETIIAKRGGLPPNFGSGRKRRNQLVQRLKQRRQYGPPVRGGKTKKKKKRRSIGGNLVRGKRTFAKNASPIHSTGTDQSVHNPNKGGSKVWVPCPRCDGEGGKSYWPGGTCYRCQGAKGEFVEQSVLDRRAKARGKAAVKRKAGESDRRTALVERRTTAWNKWASANPSLARDISTLPAGPRRDELASFVVDEEKLFVPMSELISRVDGERTDPGDFTLYEGDFQVDLKLPGTLSKGSPDMSDVHTPGVGRKEKRRRRRGRNRKDRKEA